MHVPNPLGGYPLILRGHNAVHTRPGELLMDYGQNDLYYIDKYSHERVRVADAIYKKLIEMKLENSKIEICKADDKVESEAPIIPPIEERKPNSFYMSITRAAIVSDDTEE